MLTIRVFAVSTMLIAIAAVAPGAAPAAASPRPAGTTPAKAGYCSGGNSILNYGNWECGTPNGWSPWSNITEAAGHSFRRVTYDVRQGRYAGRFEVRPGDDSSGGGQRAEVFGLPGTSQSEGDAVYYAFSIRFGAGWSHPDWGCCIVAQWRANNWSNGWPPLMLVTPKGPYGETADRVGLLQRSGNCALPPNQSCSNNVGYTLLSGETFRNTRNLWHDWIIYVKWTATTNGRVKVWHRLQGDSRFTLLLDRSNVPTLKAVDGEVAEIYSKFGLYRPDPQPYTHVLFNDSYCVARLYAKARTCLP